MRCCTARKRATLAGIKIPENLTRQAYRLVRDQILQGKLNSGQKVTEEYFAQRFQISKSPVREALNRLEADGLVRIAPRRGAFVVEFSVRDVQEIYGMREILEVAVIRELRLDKKTILKLRDVLRKAEEALRNSNKATYIVADAAFHTILANAQSNSRLRSALESMHNQLLILRHRTFELSGRTSVIQHGKILRALIDDDRDLASTLMVEHIHNVRDKLLASLSQAKEEETRSSVADADGAYHVSEGE